MRSTLPGKLRPAYEDLLLGESAKVKVPLPSGEYLNHIGGNTVRVEGGTLLCDGTPLLLTEER